jgi:hypothetical protein
MLGFDYGAQMGFNYETELQQTLASRVAFFYAHVFT